MRLGVNLDHVVTLRRVRGDSTSYPDLLHFAQIVKKFGADQITVHLREDRRHIQDQDVRDLIRWGELPINLEMALSHEMVALAEEARPDWVCLVPEKRHELTTEGGLNVGEMMETARDFIPHLKLHSKVSLFVDPELAAMEASAELGAQAVELHTGVFATAIESANEDLALKEIKRLQAAASRAKDLGLSVHAGHGLTFVSAVRIAKEIPEIEELNIGHFLVCQALYDGLGLAVSEMKRVITR